MGIGKTKAIGPKEDDVEKLIQDAFFFKYRIVLEKTDAGGKSARRFNSIPVMLTPPENLLSWLGLPSGLPFGISITLMLPPHYPDLTGYLGDNRFIFIEVKAPKKKPNPGQRAFLAKRQKEGHIAFWADSLQSAIEQYQALKGAA